MHIHEIVLQGVPGSPGLSRLTLGAGITLLVPSSEVPLPLLQLLRFALYDESVEPPAALCHQGAEASRIGVTLSDASGRFYRVLRDLRRGSVQMLRAEQAGAAFELLSSRQGEVAQTLRSAVRVPAEDLLSGLYSLAAAQYPSRQPAVVPSVDSSTRGAGAADSRGHFPGFQGAASGSAPGMGNEMSYAGGGGDAAMSPAKAEARLAELQGFLNQAEHLDDLQFKLDGLQRELDLSERGFASQRALEEKVSALRDRLQAFGDLAELPENFDEKLRRYEEGSARLDRALARVEEERSSFSERGALPSSSLKRDPSFLGSLAAGIGAIGFSLAFPSLRLVALGAPLGFGFAAFLGLCHFDKLEDKQSFARKLKTLDDAELKSKRTFELETSFVRRTMAALGVSTPAEVLARMEKLKALREAVAQGEAALAQEQSSAGGSEAQAAQGSLKAQVATIEAELAGSGGYVMDAGDIRREMATLRKLLEGGAGPASTAQDQNFAGLGGGSFGAAATGSPGSPAPSDAMPQEGPLAPPNPSGPLASLLSDVLHRDQNALLEPLLPRMSQYFGALSQGRFAQLLLEGKGELVAMEAAGARHPWEQLSVADRDLCFLAMRLCAMESALKVESTMLVLDAPFGPVSAELQPLLLKMIGGLSQGAQVLLQSSAEPWRSVAGAVHLLGSSASA